MSFKAEKPFCRCCFVEDCYDSYNASTATIIDRMCLDVMPHDSYGDLLKYALNIDMSPPRCVNASQAYTICFECIQKLCSAVQFKRQVEACEEKFKMMYDDIVSTLNGQLEVKVEVTENDLSSDIEKQEESDSVDSNADAPPVNNDSDDEMSLLKCALTMGKAAIKIPKTTKNSKEKKGESAGGPKKSPRRLRPKFLMTDKDYSTEGDTFTCLHCQKFYSKYDSLRYHVRSQHYKFPNYSCSYCDKTFMTIAPFTIHKLEEHNIDDRAKCQACNAQFNTRVQLKKHTNSFHMLGQKYKCESCDYESFSFEGVYKHRFKHKTVKDFHCRFCKKSFLRRATKELHERIHTGDRRKVCEVCGQAFVQKASLNYHMTKYHPEVNF